MFSHSKVCKDEILALILSAFILIINIRVLTLAAIPSLRNSTITVLAV
jgi:hypothetical protein